MTTVIVHDTPGLIDIRAFTVMGINAKPETKSPIGYFGTGLKYAIAVLLREGLKVTVWIGDDPYEFFSQRYNFRGKEFDMIKMRRQRGATRRWFVENLPFTTELGKNWQLWMALRELHSNTLDENGTSYLSASTAKLRGAYDRTRIVIEGESYAHTFLDLSTIFLSGLERKNTGCHIVSYEPSKYAYYRGMRVAELQYPANHTYSVETTLSLTEDRTLASQWMWDYYVRHEIMSLTDEGLLRDILTAAETTYEANIAWDANEYNSCTPEFLRCVRLYGNKSARVFMTHERQARARTRVSWRLQLMNAIKDSNNSEILRVIRENESAVLGLLERDYEAFREQDERIMQENNEAHDEEEPLEEPSLDYDV